MNKLASMKTKKIDKEDLTEKASIIAAVICAIFVVEVIGSIFSYIIGSNEHSFFYNFLVGFGIITSFAFIVAILQEFFEK